jgi:hypothetical protein
MQGVGDAEGNGALAARVDGPYIDRASSIDHSMSAIFKSMKKTD